MKKNLISVISINYNQTAVTFKMLDSFRKSGYRDVQIIIVDNASNDRSIDEITEKYPEVVYVNSPENLGFAGGNNLGLKQAQGEFILFLNNDTEVTDGFLEPLLMKLREDDRIGMVCPKIRFFFNPDTIQFAGYTELNKVTIRNNLVGYRQKDTGQFDTERKTPLGHGAAMMVKREVIEKVGPMAHIYFLYYEELDWCTRISKAGYDIWYVPDSLVYHKESITTGKMSPLKIYYLTRNRILFTRRNTKGFSFLISLLYQVFIAGPKNTLLYLVKGKFSLLLAFCKGYLWHLSHLFDRNLHKNDKIW